MSGLVDQYGYPVYCETKFSKGAQQGVNKPFERQFIGDIDDLIPSYDWRTLLSASRRLFTNMGIVKSATIQKANYSIGRSWNPVFKGKDKEWGKQAEDWLLEQFYPASDVRGSMFDFKTDLYIDSIAIDRDGDFFILLTESKDGFPQTQRIPAHRVGQRQMDGALTSGPFKKKGNTIKNGVIYNNIGRPIAYRVLGQEAKEDRDISTRNMIHVFNPNWHEQGRGLMAATHAIDNLLSAVKSEEYEQMAQLMLSSIGLIEHNEMGMADEGDPANFLRQNATNVESGLTTQTFAGGSVRYFKANSGSKLETINQDRPGNVWESYQDRVARLFITGMNWSYSFVWKSAELTGTSQRAEIEKVRRSIDDRQALLEMPSKRVIGYAIAKAQKLGILPENSEWWKWGFTLPPKISIDPGKDSVANLNEWRAGAKNMTQILSEQGLQYEDQMRQRANEISIRKKVQQETEKRTGIQIDDREMAMYTPNEMAEPKEDEQQKED
jgi:capsid protein